MHEQSLPPSDRTEPTTPEPVSVIACPVCARSGLVFETEKGWLKKFVGWDIPTFQRRLRGAAVIPSTDLVNRDRIIGILLKHHIRCTVYCVIANAHES